MSLTDRVLSTLKMGRTASRLKQFAKHPDSTN
jgi:hypothetical protein